jgi:hypothetical protein
VPVGYCYALSYDTYQEICNLLNRDLSECEVIKGFIPSGAKPGTTVNVRVEGQTNYVKAIQWYEGPSGEAKVFKVDGKQYVISLVAPKLISKTVSYYRRTGGLADPNREIKWTNFIW